MIDFVPFDQIQLRDIERLRDSEVPEGRTIEYKDEDPTSSNEAKRDFRESITSFANTEGGDLLYGVKADKTKAIIVNTPGLIVTSPDQFELALNQTLRDRVDPRIQPVQYRWVDMGGGKCVVVIRVQQSWTAPHAATKFGAYFQRTSKGKQSMDAHELRNAFLLAGRAEERFEKFCSERHSVLLGEQSYEYGPQPVIELEDGAILLIHAAPLATMGRPYTLDIRSNVPHLRRIRPYRVIQHHNVQTQPNVEGYLASVSAHKSYAYWQVFRSGVIEAAAVFEPRPAPGGPPNGTPVLNAAWFERTAVGECTALLALLADLGFSPPSLLSVALLKGSKFAFQLGGHYQGRTWDDRVLGRDFLSLGTCVAEDQQPDVPELLRPIFDAFWNAFGLEGSRNYADDGKWQAPQN